MNLQYEYDEDHEVLVINYIGRLLEREGDGGGGAGGRNEKNNS